MNHWLDALHANSPAYPPGVTAIKIAIALTVGFLIGFERQWSRKDFGVRTFSLTAILGALTAVLSPMVMLISFTAIVMLAVLLNVRDIIVSRSLEGTTSVALVLTFVLGLLAGEGHIFTPVACAIVMTSLLSLKPEFRRFAGGVQMQEIRSAVLLALFSFVVWPLLPSHALDPWGLLEPREAWITVIVVSALGFLNYVLLRVYGARGLSLTAIFGGLVNSTAAAAELAATLQRAGMLSQAASSILLTSVAMFVRNFLLLAIFGRSAVESAAIPLLGMALVSGWFLSKRRREPLDDGRIELRLSSPIALGKVLRFSALFVVLQVLGTLASRRFGSAGLIVVSLIGGLVSSASSTAAAAILLSHGAILPSQAAAATVVTSVTSAFASLPVVYRQIRDRKAMRELILGTVLQAVVGIGLFVLLQWLGIHPHL